MPSNMDEMYDVIYILTYNLILIEGVYILHENLSIK